MVKAAAKHIAAVFFCVKRVGYRLDQNTKNTRWGYPDEKQQIRPNTPSLQRPIIQKIYETKCKFYAQ